MQAEESLDTATKLASNDELAVPQILRKITEGLVGIGKLYAVDFKNPTNGNTDVPVRTIAMHVGSRLRISDCSSVVL